jgi:esterase/lipase superfamily enzyme
MADLNESLQQLILGILNEIAPGAMLSAGTAWLSTTFSVLLPDDSSWSIYAERLCQALAGGPAPTLLKRIYGERSASPEALIITLLADETIDTPPSPAPSVPPPTAPPKSLRPPTIAKPALDRVKANATAVRIFYATDRALSTDEALEFKFDTGRDHAGTLHLGECEVTIPACHKSGRMESPSILRLEFRPNPDRHIVLAKVNSLAEEEFVSRVKASVASSTAKDAFIFVHGYNVTFADAARRTGQFAFDLSFAGAPILYSWPANGHTLDYPADEASVIWTAPHLERFLSLLMQHAGAQKIHVLAHSMGNRAVCDAVKSLSARNAAGPSVLLHQLVLAAPDIDSDTFREMASALKTMSGQITLYASSKDKAIQLSRKLHENPRAGGPPIVIAAGVDSIDASKVDTDFLAHSYFIDTQTLLLDIHQLLANDTPPAQRSGLQQEKCADGLYFAFK